MQRDSATSPAMGNILMLVIVIILAAILVAMILSMPLLQYSFTPAIFIITSIESVDEITQQSSDDSRVILLHTGTAIYQNKNLKAQFYKNGIQVDANIGTMNGHDFISTSHNGVQWMGGMGCSGVTWTPGEMICIDFSDETFHPGDSVRVDIIDKSMNQVISRHIYRMQ
jgi:hypothetical protein